MLWRASEIIKTRWCSRQQDWEQLTSTSNSKALAARMAHKTLILQQSQVEVAHSRSMGTATDSSLLLGDMPTAPIATTRTGLWWSQAQVWTPINPGRHKSVNRRSCSSHCSFNRISLRSLKAPCRLSHKSCSKITRANRFYLQLNLHQRANIRKTKQ